MEFTNDLVYEKPKGDLIIFVQNKLQNFGLSQGEIATFISNSAVPLSLQVSVVEDLKGLGDIPGRRAAAVALGNMMTEYQARFLATSLHMLNKWGQQKSPITEIQVPGSAGCAGSERHRDSARAGRLRIVDAAHRRFCDYPRIAGHAEPRALDSRQDDSACAAAVGG